MFEGVLDIVEIFVVGVFVLIDFIFYFCLICRDGYILYNIEEDWFVYIILVYGLCIDRVWVEVYEIVIEVLG